MSDDHLKRLLQCFWRFEVDLEQQASGATHQSKQSNERRSRNQASSVDSSMFGRSDSQHDESGDQSQNC